MDSSTEQVLEKDTNQTVVVPDGARVLNVKHWTDRLFSFEVERPQSLRFRAGEFVMLGLVLQNAKHPETTKPLLRAYSIASPPWEETLEFYSIKVENGPLTSRLQLIQQDDYIVLRKKPVGTLVLDALLPAKNLWLFATGTGVAPFLSVTREPETYERFEHVHLVHCCRHTDELSFAQSIVDEIGTDEILSEFTKGKFHYSAMTTRSQDVAITGRITDRLSDGLLVKSAESDFEHVRSEPYSLDKSIDRVMICGSLGFNTDMTSLLTQKGFNEGTDSQPGHFVVEKAFVS